MKNEASLGIKHLLTLKTQFENIGQISHNATDHHQGSSWFFFFFFFFFFWEREDSEEIKKWANTENKLFSHFYTIGPGQEWTALMVEKSVMFLFPGVTCE